jgi:hypothetical protein
MLRADRHQYLYLADNPRFRVERARNVEDLTAAFQVLHDTYVRAGLITARALALRITAHQLLPSSDVFVAKVHDEVVATLSLIGDSSIGLPMESMYVAKINALRQTGESLAEVGCLADRRSRFSRSLEAFYAMTRLMAQTARRRGITMLVAAVHPRHARFYQQVLGFDQLAGETQCPYAAGKPAVALGLRFEDKRGTRIYDQYFAEALPDDETSPIPVPDHIRQHFATYVEPLPSDPAAADHGTPAISPGLAATHSTTSGATV